MDLGCGQGDQSGALAALVAEKGLGKVVGVDPAPGDYGTPYTLKQAQEHLKEKEELKGVLEFRLGEAGPEALEKGRYDTVVLSHSLWYFPSAQLL